jgi:hypothetical protein
MKKVPVVGFEVFTVVVMKTAIFWDIALCSLYMNWHFEGTYHLHLQGRKSAEEETSVRAHTFLRNVGSYTDYMALYPRRWQFLKYLLFLIVII